MEFNELSIRKNWRGGIEGKLVLTHGDTIEYIAIGLPEKLIEMIMRDMSDTLIYDANEISESIKKEFEKYA